MLCATYPGNAESGQFFNQILMPHGIAGKCLVALFHLNLLTLAVFIIFHVLISLIWSAGINHYVFPWFETDIAKNEWSNWSLSDDNHGFMLGHYFFFLKFLSDNLTAYIGVIYAKWNNLEITEPSGYRFDTAPTLLMAWLCTKYQCHFPMELLMFATSRLIIPISAVHRLVRTGVLSTW